MLEVNWPDTEPIPKNMKEALALGWTAGDEYSTPSDDECVSTGTMELKKRMGLMELRLTIPFRAEYSYGQPHNARAIVDVSTEEMVS